MPQNIMRPTGLLDFDLMLAHEFTRRESRANGAIWTTSFGTNIACLGISLVLWAILVCVAIFDIGFAELDMWLKILLGAIYCLFIGVTFMLTTMIFYRGRLIIDWNAEELRYCGWTDKPRHTLHMRDIRGLSFENVQHVSGSDVEMQDGSTSSTTSTQYLVAELHDGRMVSIATGATAQLYKDITGWTDADMEIDEDALSVEDEEITQ